VFLLYDSDQAGLKATFRAGDILLANGMSVRVVSLPDGEDPDTFVAKTGAEGFERAASASVDVFDRKIQILERSGWFADLRRKREALDKLLPTIRVTSDRLTRDLYIARTTEVAGISREMLQRELDAPPRGVREPGETGAPPEQAPGVRSGADRRANHRRYGSRAERELVRVLLHRRRYVEPVAERIEPERFSDSAAAAIFIQLTAGDPEATIDELAANLDADAIDLLQLLMDETGGLDRAEETLDASINALLSRSIDDRLTEIDRLLPLAASEQKDELIREKGRLTAEMKALGRARWKSFHSPRP
jgi:DNA primase